VNTSERKVAPKYARGDIIFVAENKNAPLAQGTAARFDFIDRGD
jgi:hypothetical protein